jgi:hypothetical protein
MQKPISIDDMFSLVTKEVRLVTKNAQRPYKYASLENIVCVAPNCSSSAFSASSAPLAPTEQAQRSETEDLQVATETRNVAALEAFIEKFPDSSKRGGVQKQITDLRRSEFAEWTLYEIGNRHNPWYLQLSSIQILADRVAIKLRFPIDPSSSKVFFGKPIPDAEYIEQVVAYDCVKHTSADSEDTILGNSNNILYHYKFSDPRYLDLSVAQKIAAGSVSYSLMRLACNENLNTPSVSKTELSKMSFSSLSSTLSGDGDLFYKTLPNNSEIENEKQFLFVMRYYQDRPVAFAPGTSIPEVPSYRTEIDKVRLDCVDKKVLATKSEFYSVSGNLVYMTVGNPDVTNQNWIKIDIAQQSPLSSLYRIFCSSGEATK